MRLFLILLSVILLSVPIFGQETAEDWVKKGNKLSDQGKYNDAVQAYDKALEIDPQYAQAWNDKGLALDNLLKYNAAIECFDNAIKINPQLSAAKNNKIFALRNQRKALPETGTYIKDTGRNGHGELTIVNENHTYDALAVLASPNKELIIAAFIRSNESFRMTELNNGIYDLYISFGKTFNRESNKFMEEGGYYRLDKPLIFNSTSNSTRDKIKIGFDYFTYRYISWTISLEEPTAAGNNTTTKEIVTMAPISASGFPLVKDFNDSKFNNALPERKIVASIIKEMKIEEREVKYEKDLLLPHGVGFTDHGDYSPPDNGPVGDLSGVPPGMSGL